MKTAMLLATAVALATSSHHPKVSFNCADLKRQPDGTWTVVRTTIIAITNSERRSQLFFAADEGTRFPPDREVPPPAKDDVLAHFFEEETAGVDVVGELDKQCR